MNKQEKAIELFRNSYNCSQAVFTSFGTENGLNEDICLRISCAFGGGIGRMQHTCGAVTGALMTIGMYNGKGINDPEEKKLHTYSSSRIFFERFIEKNGSTNCRELLNNLDMNNPEDLLKIKDLKLFNLKCEKYVIDAVELTEEIINK